MTTNALALAAAQAVTRELDAIAASGYQPAQLAAAVTANVATIAAITAIPDPVKDVRWYGAKGDGKTNDTAAFQAAADSGELIVGPGDYLIDAVKTVAITKNGTKAKFDDAAILRAIPNNQDRYYILRITASDCDIDVGGAQFIGDRDRHTYTVGKTHEHGYCISCGGSRNKLHGNEKGRITGATGDGLAVVGPDHEIWGLVLDGNRRQGCSAFNAPRLNLHHNVFSNTGNYGKPDPAGLIGPFCGFDIEPDRGDCLDVNIHHNTFGPNNRSGAIAWINSRAAKETPKMMLTGKFTDNTFIGNTNGTWLCREVAGTTPTIIFEFMRNRFVNNGATDIKCDQGSSVKIGDTSAANANVFDDFKDYPDAPRTGLITTGGAMQRLRGAVVNAGINQIV